jgi:hypothetical protein
MPETILSDSENRRLTWREQRRFVRIPEASAYSGLNAQRLYEEAGRREGLFRKSSTNTTIVDLDILDDILNSFPVADVKKTEPRIYRKKRPLNSFQKNFAE